MRIFIRKLDVRDLSYIDYLIESHRRSLNTYPASRGADFAGKILGREESTSSCKKISVNGLLFHFCNPYYCFGALFESEFSPL
jgi:hypothetical protein